MKQLIILSTLLLLTMYVFPENAIKHSRVKVFASTESQFKTLLQLGLPLESLVTKRGEYFIGEYSTDEIIKIKNSSIKYEILIDDISAFYVNRNKGVDIKELNAKIKKNKRDFNGIVTPTNFKLGSFGGYHNYNEILLELDEMHTLYPQLISEKTIASDITTNEGRPIYMVRISNNPSIDQNKTKILYTALTHAREPAGMQQMLFQMWYLLENYATNPEIKYLVDNLEIFFIPCVNPDGYIYNQTTDPNGGGMWRKNMRNNGDGSIGVDLNRNFGYMWGYDDSGSSPDGSSMTYRGTSGFSEPETQVIKEICETRNFNLALNNHTYSDILIYPFAYDNVLTPDSSLFIEYAKRMTQANKYIYGTCYQTLNYTANGGSDDWFYGEQTTKNKILAFTPEAGSPSDGFWPQANKIEEICSGHTEMNLYIMRFALPYAEITDDSEKFISATDYTFHFSLLPLGNVDLSSFTVAMEPITDNILSISEEQTFANLEKLESTVGTASISLKANTLQGEMVKWAVHISNGEFTSTDTITKYYGTVTYLVNNDCESMEEWTSTSWNTTTQEFISGTKSISDSPTGSYSDNANTTITYIQTIDLSSSIMANAQFMAKWDIESGYDYVQFLVSENGTTWIPLSGNYTILGEQADNEPLYDGTSDWVAEEIDLSPYLGKQIQVRFALKSDGSVTEDGFFFDDFKIVSLEAQTAPTLNLPERFTFLHDSSINIYIPDYIASESTLDDLSFTWTGNINTEISINNWMISISATDNSWIGEEVVRFNLEYNSGTTFKDVILESKAHSSIHVTQNDCAPKAFYRAETKTLIIQNSAKYINHELKILSINGRIEKQRHIKSAYEEVDLSNFSNGIYIINISDEISIKIVVY